MPTAPSYQRETQTGARPDVRVSPEAPATAFGVPRAEDGRDSALGITSAAIGALGALVLQEKEKADQIAVQSADKDLANLETQLLYSETGALSRRGKDAFDVPTQFTEEWNKRTSEIEARLTNDTQRTAFNRALTQRTVGVQRTIQRHVAEQRQRYDADELEAYLVSERNAGLFAAHDADRVMLSAMRQKAAVLDYGKRNGWGPETTAERTADVVSKTFAGAIIKLADDDQDVAASTFYGKVRDQLQGDEKTQVDKALEESSLRGRSQRALDEIVAVYSDRGEALEYARIKYADDPKLRDELEDRLVRFFGARREAFHARQEELYRKADAIIKNNPGARVREIIPTSIWNDLSPEMRNALERVGEDGPHDNKAWLDFLDLERTDLRSLASMPRGQFEATYWSKFDASHRARAEEIWTNAGNALAKGNLERDPQLAATLSFHDRIDNTLRSVGLVRIDKSAQKMSKMERQLYIDMEQEAARQIQEYEINELKGQRKASGTEQQEIIDRIVSKRVFIKEGFTADEDDPQKPVDLLNEDERGRAFVPYTLIPAGDRNSIENILKSRKLRRTEGKVSRAYAAFLMGDRNLFENILIER